MCEAPENPDFLRKDKMVISVKKNPEFFYISNGKMDFTIGIASRNLVTTLNFFEFRDSRNFTFFEALEGMHDTWHVLGGQEAPRVL